MMKKWSGGDVISLGGWSSTLSTPWTTWGRTVLLVVVAMIVFDGRRSMWTFSMSTGGGNT